MGVLISQHLARGPSSFGESSREAGCWKHSIKAGASATYSNWFVNHFFTKQMVEMRVVPRQGGPLVGRHSGPKGTTQMMEPSDLDNGRGS